MCSSRFCSLSTSSIAAPSKWVQLRVWEGQGVSLINGKKVVNPLRQEVVTIRSIVPGEYVVNASYYDAKDIDASDPRAGKPVEATLSIIKVNPKAEVIFYGQSTLEARGKEVTMARFTVTPGGGTDNINTIPKSLMSAY